MPDIILEEVREDEFKPVAIERLEIAFKFCFLQVVLAILKHFPNLGANSPVIKRKRKRNSIALIISRLSAIYKIKVLRLA
jgi:hypothetical protein